jgi:hypothetical protein
MDPALSGEAYRTTVYEASGLTTDGRVESLRLDDFGDPLATHCVYIAFRSDYGWSPADGTIPTTLGVAMVVDNIELAGGTTLAEDFEGDDTRPAISRVDFFHNDTPFGEWARTFSHITDNDHCTENATCAWLFTDDTTPTIATDPSMAFGPGGYVIRNWLDDIIVSPWVSLVDAAGSELFMSFREFGGNAFDTSRIVRNWSVRSLTKVDNTDTPAPGDSIDCYCWASDDAFGWSSWGHRGRWNTLDSFTWNTRTFALDPFVDAACARRIQVRFRVSDWQYIETGGYPAPAPFIPGPGPYIDQVRIGRRVLAGPVFRHGIATTVAGDAFPTEIHPFIDPSTGEHHRPTTDRFGTAAFSRASDLSEFIAPGPQPYVVTGDSIAIEVTDARGAGGITRVEWYGAIVSGPHIGKAPPPYSVSSNGFFVVPADTAFLLGVPREDTWCVDLDDDYFRGGDVLLYFWFAEDAQGALSSDPEGLVATPTSVEEAETLTGGLYEVSFLPTIRWDPGYLARVAADPNGKLEPTQEELANSAQSNSILYCQLVNARRLSGDANRTSFMYTLDRLGYRGHYDVYDDAGGGNHLGGRATVEQATGYALIVQDTGTQSVRATRHPLPDGSDLLENKIDQAGWYRDWLARADQSETGTAALWFVGSRVAELHPANPLWLDMGVDLASPDVLPALGANPDVEGQTVFTFANGDSADFTSDQFTVQAACPDFPPYNGIDAAGTSVVTHRWANDTSVGDGAIVMNTNAAQSWNAIMQVPTWREIREPNSTPSAPDAEEQLMTKILNGVLPPEDIQTPDPATDVRDDTDELDALPRVTALYQNAPNPFNPTTTIRFDLAREAHVELRVYNVSGRLVHTLVNEPMERKRHQVVWDGMDNAGVPVSSGIYFYRLQTADFRDTRKMVVLR